MGKRARARRRAALQVLQSMGFGADIAAHMYDQQAEPQLLAADLQDRGMDIEVGMVDTGADAEGWPVTCLGCGRTATLPYEPPREAALCPACQRKRFR